MKYGGRLYIYKITEDWDMGTISYENAPPYKEENLLINKLCEGYESSASVKEFDITDYVRSLKAGSSTANIMIKCVSTERKDPSHIHGINTSSPPYIRVVLD